MNGMKAVQTLAATITASTLIVSATVGYGQTLQDADIAKAAALNDHDAAYHAHDLADSAYGSLDSMLTSIEASWNDFMNANQVPQADKDEVARLYDSALDHLDLGDIT